MTLTHRRPPHLVTLLLSSILLTAHSSVGATAGHKHNASPTSSSFCDVLRRLISAAHNGFENIRGASAHGAFTCTLLLPNVPKGDCSIKKATSSDLGREGTYYYDSTLFTSLDASNDTLRATYASIIANVVNCLGSAWTRNDKTGLDDEGSVMTHFKNTAEGLEISMSLALAHEGGIINMDLHILSDAD